MNNEPIILYHCNSCRRDNLPIEMFKLKRNMKYTKSCFICRKRKLRHYYIRKTQIANANVEYSSSNLQQ